MILFRMQPHLYHWSSLHVSNLITYFQTFFIDRVEDCIKKLVRERNAERCGIADEFTSVGTAISILADTSAMDNQTRITISTYNPMSIVIYALTFSDKLLYPRFIPAKTSEMRNHRYCR